MPFKKNNFYEFYQRIRLKDNKVRNSFILLENLYKQMPETKGCLENLGDCKADCCQLQSPQLLYCEFLYIWDYICKNCSNEKLYDLLRRCMINSVYDSPSKKCVFFNGKNKLCNCHLKRSLNCRIYGITPNEEFNKRIEKVKERYKNDSHLKIKPQCNLISTLNNEEVSTEDINKWWDNLEKIEEYIGIDKKDIHDGINGSYRAPHDHILLYNLPEEILNVLSTIREYNNYSDKLNAINDIIDGMKEYFKKQGDKNE